MRSLNFRPTGNSTAIFHFISFPPLLICLLISLIFPPLSHSQDGEKSYKDAKQLKNDGNEAYNRKQYKEAIEILKKFIAKYPKNPDVPNAHCLIGLSHYSLGNYEEATKNLKNFKDFPTEFIPVGAFHLGASHYSLGQYDQAIQALTVASTSKDQDIIPYALFYIGRSHLEKASKIHEKNFKEAEKAYQAGATSVSQLIEKYPDSEIINDALLTRSSLFLSLKQFKKAQGDLEALLQRPDTGSMKEDINFLLGISLANQANSLLLEEKREEASKIIAQAKEVYRRLLKTNNVIVANEAAFELANLTFADREYEEALTAYRSVQSKYDTVQAQKKRLDNLKKAAGRANGNQLKALQRQIRNEQQKLEAVQRSPERALDALIRIGDVYLQTGRYNEARIVYRHTDKFADENQKKRLTIQIIISQALQGLAEKAEASFNEFLKKYPNDPIVKNVPYLIGDALAKQEKYKEALAKYEEALQKYPKAPAAKTVTMKMAAIFSQQGKTEEAIKTFRDFIKKAESKQITVSDEALEQSKRQLALLLYREKKIDEAITIISELAKSAKTPSIKEDAYFQKGSLLFFSQKYAECIPAFKEYIKLYPKTPNAPKAAAQIANAYVKLKKMDEAIAAFQNVIKDFPGSSLALFSYRRIAETYLAQGKIEQVIAIQEKMFKAFPNAPENLQSLFQRAEYLRKKQKTEEALKAYTQIVKMYESFPKASQTIKLQGFPAFSLQRQAAISLTQAKELGKYATLTEEQKSVWKKHVTMAEQYLDQAIKSYYRSSTMPLLLTKMLQLKRLKIKNQIEKLSSVQSYFSKLAGTFDDETASLQTLATRANLNLQEGFPGQALKDYEKIFSETKDPKKFSWQNYAQYGNLLLDEKKWDQALTIFQQLKEHFKKPQHAQAEALYGMGAAYQGKKDFAKAKTYFAQLEKNYAWSPKVQEVKFNLGVIKASEEKYEEAFVIWKETMRSPNSSNEVRAKSMLEFGKTLEIMGDKGLKTKETKLRDKEIDIYQLAVNYFLKVDVYYEDTLPNISAEALYNAVRIHTKNGKAAEAKKILDDMLKKYPVSPWTDKARNL